MRALSVAVVISVLAVHGVATAAAGHAPDVAAETAVIDVRPADAPAPLTAGPIEAAGLRAAAATVAPDVTAPRHAVDTQSTPSKGRSWIARHPVLFGALAGAVVGTSVAAAAWGNEGAFVGFYGGAAAGAVVGAVLR